MSSENPFPVDIDRHAPVHKQMANSKVDGLITHREKADNPAPNLYSCSSAPEQGTSAAVAFIVMALPSVALLPHFINCHR